MKPTVLTITLNPSLDKTIVLDRLQPGMLNRAMQVRLDPGGKGINVARLLSNFQVSVVASGLCGGSEGHVLLDGLRKAGVSDRFLEVAGPTRTNLKIVDASSQVTTEINERGAEVSETELAAFLELFERCLENTTHIVLGGSLPPGIPATIYADLIRLANRKNIMTVLDADGEAFAAGIEAVPYALKPNIHELEMWCGRTLQTDEDIVAAGRSVLSRGIPLMIVSMGKDGSVALSEKEAYRVTPFPIEAKSTVGAGDSMVATMIYCLLQGMSLSEMAAMTAAAGTLTASKEGTQVCTMEEIKQNVHRIRIQTIS